MGKRLLSYEERESRNKLKDFLIFIGVITLMEITLLVEIIIIILEVQKVFK